MFVVPGSFLDTAAEDQRVEARANALLRLAAQHGSNFWVTPERSRQIVRFQDRAGQVRDFLDFCTKTLFLVYGTMFPRNKMPELFLHYWKSFEMLLESMALCGLNSLLARDLL